MAAKPEVPRIEHEEEEFLRQMRVLTTDARGESVLVGLTRAESEEYGRLHDQITREQIAGESPWSCPEEREREINRWLELNQKHEVARQQAIGPGKSSR